MDITLIKELAGLDKVCIALLKLALFDDELPLVPLLVCLYQLAIARIDETMRGPEIFLDIVLAGIFKVGKDHTLGCNTKPETTSAKNRIPTC